jgi:hypothetical protein
MTFLENYLIARKDFQFSLAECFGNFFKKIIHKNQQKGSKFPSFQKVFFT